MIKKILMPAMMMLTTLAILPSNKTIKANADTKNVEKGYISTNLVNSNGYVNVVDKKEDIEANFVNRLGDFQVVDWNTLWMRELFANNTPKDETTSFCKYNDTDEFNKFSIGNKKVDFIAENEAGRYYSLVYEKISVNTLFDDWDKENEQPLELAYNFTYSISDDDMYLFKTLFDDYEIQDFSIPLLKIDGESIVELVKENDSISFKRCNSRVYLGLHDSDFSDENFCDYSGDFFVEIPFKNYIQTIEMYQFRIWYDNYIGKNVPITWLLNDNFYLYKLAADNSIFSPFNFSNIDLKSGLITAVAADRATKIDTAFGYISDHYNLDYIIINNDTLVYTQPTGNYYLDNGREQEYKMYLDNTFKTPFNYDCDNAFVNKLRKTTEDVDFNITYFSYSLVFDNTNLEKNLHEILDDFLRPGGYTKPSISDSDLKDKIGINPSPIIKQPKSLRRATSSSQVSNAVVDCGLFYVFRYNTEFSVHTLDIKATSWMDGFQKNSFLNFEVSDQSIGLNVSKINGVIFYYSVSKEDYKTKHSLSMVSGDIEVDSSKNLAFFDKNNYIIKKDKFGYQFYLGSTTIWDWSILHPVNVGESFTLSVEGKIHFENITSVIYTTDAGEIINLSGLSNTFGKGYTGVIKEDGTIIIIDKDGKTHPGYHFDPATGVLKDPLENEVPSPVVPKPTNVLDEFLKALKKIGSILGTIAIVGGVIWTISKVGPTLVMIFKKKE